VGVQRGLPAQLLARTPAPHGGRRRRAARSYTCSQAARGESVHEQRRTAPAIQETTMTLGTILLVVLILLLVGALPAWPHSRSWGYGPTGGLGLVLVIVIVLLLLGRL
jgi:hypothetical protein